MDRMIDPETLCARNLRIDQGGEADGRDWRVSNYRRLDDDRRFPRNQWYIPRYIVGVS